MVAVGDDETVAVAADGGAAAAESVALSSGLDSLTLGSGRVAPPSMESGSSADGTSEVRFMAARRGSGRRMRWQISERLSGSAVTLRRPKSDRNQQSSNQTKSKPRVD